MQGIMSFRKDFNAEEGGDHRWFCARVVTWLKCSQAPSGCRGEEPREHGNQVVCRDGPDRVKPRVYGGWKVTVRDQKVSETPEAETKRRRCRCFRVWVGSDPRLWPIAMSPPQPHPAPFLAWDPGKRGCWGLGAMVPTCDPTCSGG